jgi:hypothetical protein
LITGPPGAFDVWDLVVECGVVVASGRLRVYSPEVDAVVAPTVNLPPGTYRALVQYGGLDTVEDEMELEGGDHYRVTLWPNSYVEPRLVKS